MGMKDFLEVTEEGRRVYISVFALRSRPNSGAVSWMSDLAYPYPDVDGCH